jgi:hypothetical protein
MFVYSNASVIDDMDESEALSESTESYPPRQSSARCILRSGQCRKLTTQYGANGIYSPNTDGH